jgi:hypothetical protein
MMTEMRLTLTSWKPSAIISTNSINTRQGTDMPRIKEQFDRFYAVLSAKGEFSIDCKKCPIKEQCFEYAETHCPETDDNALCCEELLLSFVLTGETPTP